ncbi:MAG: PIN domain-containing protein [bacterium]|nr:PIN domain-containing protein [bacterium]
MTQQIPLEPLYVVDTHALIWYLLRDSKLSQTALDVFRGAERGETLLIISVVVLAEFYYANAKNRWFNDYQVVYQDLLSKPFFKFIPLDAIHILDFDRDNRVPEMHDRIIAGVARRLDAPLVSSDPLIRSAGIVRIIW